MKCAVAAILAAFCVAAPIAASADDALDVLWYGLAVAVVSATLLAVRWVGGSARH